MEFPEGLHTKEDIADIITIFEILIWSLSVQIHCQ